MKKKYNKENIDTEQKNQKNITNNHLRVLKKNQETRIKQLFYSF